MSRRSLPIPHPTRTSTEGREPRPPAAASVHALCWPTWRTTQPRMALRAWQLGQRGGGGVEARQVVVSFCEQALEAWHAVVVGGNRGQLRIVEALRDPLVVERVGHALAVLELADLPVQLREDLLLAFAHELPRDTGGVQMRQARARGTEHSHRGGLTRLLVAVLADAHPTALVGDPALKSRILHRGGEGFVERRVI